MAIVLTVMVDVAAIALLGWGLARARRRGAPGDDGGRSAGLFLLGVALVLLSTAVTSATP